MFERSKLQDLKIKTIASNWIFGFTFEITFKIILNEGKYHQIRRMVVARGNKVVDLKRIRIGNIKLNDLEEGNYLKIDKLPFII